MQNQKRTGFSVRFFDRSTMNVRYLAPIKGIAIAVALACGVDFSCLQNVANRKGKTRAYIIEKK